MQSEDKIFDFIIIGAGIAGASVAAYLAPEAEICLVEAESQAGYHATGRSAAMYVPAYGPPAIRKLTRASGDFFHNPPDGFSDANLLSPRDILLVGTKEQSGSFDDFKKTIKSASNMVPISANGLQNYQPLLRDGYGAQGLLDPTGSDIDVDALHRGFLRQATQNGAEVKTNHIITSMMYQNGVWHLHHKQGVIKAKAIINAAGAWAEEIGRMAGAEHISLTPKRRTALIISADPSLELVTMPMTIDIDEAFYLKPEVGQILISPANEDPMAPCDAQADEMDIAICIDRIERAFDLNIRRIESKWAGLRSFVPDKEPVVGYSEMAEGFFWLAGQGGYGIQTSPAMGRMAAALALGREIPDDIQQQGLAEDSLLAARLQR